MPFVECVGGQTWGIEKTLEIHTPFVVGQRWISASEPELGLGIVVAFEHRRVRMHFPLREEERVYMTQSAPLHRYVLSVGDDARSTQGGGGKVMSVIQDEGLVTYRLQDGIDLQESLLHPLVELTSVRQRILAAQPEPDAAFALRKATFERMHWLGRSAARGFIGARVELLGHQLSIADRVCQRSAPRVLLADEVGLGKTIEAGLILHKGLLAGSVTRALILVPDSLLHQWLVELLRKFNIAAALIDGERYDALEGENPFEAEQIILAPLSLISSDESRARQAQSAHFDLLIVDEAHRLGWTQGEISDEYRAVETVAAAIPSVLLLSATPEQRGIDGHFARLRLVDPNRFHDLDSFRAEQEDYEALGSLIDSLLSLAESAETPEAYDLPAELGQRLVDKLGSSWGQRLKSPDADTLDQTVRALLDRFGTGRVLFRNTRRHVGGFPPRRMHEHALDGNDELLAKTEWLVRFLRQNPTEKALLIARTADVAAQLEDVLRRREAIPCAAFHEGMPLINRDRAAAYFAADEEGAQVLLCSEIGGEGRNFQFARNLILFDLPSDPDLVEQRIGRLDRIGRSSPVEIHLPYVVGSEAERVFHWLAQGVDAFSGADDVGARLYAEFGPRLREPDQDLDHLIRQTRDRRQELRRRQRSGRDRLLEVNSFDRQRAAELESLIGTEQDAAGLLRYLTSLCDYVGLELEPQSDDSLILRPSDHQLLETIAGLPEDGLTGTLSRNLATRREDLEFLSWEHPVVLGMMHTVLDEGIGRLAVVSTREARVDPGSVLVEALYTLDVPGAMRLEQFKEDPLMRSVTLLGEKSVDPDLRIPAKMDKVNRATATEVLRRIRGDLTTTLDAMEDVMQDSARLHATQLKQRVAAHYDLEIERLQALRAVNDTVRPQEIEEFETDKQRALEQAEGARLQTEAVRIIICL